jgi:tetratricopeptide (TPR) repeat protein
MKIKLYISALLFLSIIISAQKKTFKCEKIYDAIKLVDEKKYDEGIAILKDCEKIDSKDITYPYEIALAYTYKKDYKSAVSQLEKIKNYENLDDSYFALLGNNYDYLNNPVQAVKTYDEGLKRFPNSGKLHLEKGVIYEFDKKYSDAVKTFEKGIQVAPDYPSNYYRAANIYLNSDNKLNGLIYGEIFLNIERSSNRTKEMSEKLYEAYKNAIIFKSKNEKQISICKSINIDINTFEKNSKLPFCTIFEKNIVLSMIDQNEFNLDNLSSIRRKFLREYFIKDYKDYPNALLNYHKKMEDSNVFDAYNHYIFQMGDSNTFNIWKESHQSEYNKFVEWYTKDENKIK